MDPIAGQGQAAARKRRNGNTPGTAIVPVAQVAAVIPLDPEALIAKGIEHGISVEGLERLLAMRERLKAEQARSAYVHAVAQFQGACPIITKLAVVRDKDGKERYRYASLESIVKQVGPLLRASDLTYRIDTRIEEGQAIPSPFDRAQDRPAPSGAGSPPVRRGRVGGGATGLWLGGYETPRAMRLSSAFCEATCRSKMPIRPESVGFWRRLALPLEAVLLACPGGRPRFVAVVWVGSVMKISSGGGIFARASARL